MFKKKKDKFTLFKDKKTAMSLLDVQELKDKIIDSGVKCGNCNKVFYKFSEVYIEYLNVKLPCCPYCKSDVLTNEMK